MLVIFYLIQVAIKVIDKKKAKEDVYVRKNLRREGKLLQMVRHRHVIQLLEIMETENSYYLVTELCQVHISLRLLGTWYDRLCTTYNILSTRFVFPI